MTDHARDRDFGALLLLLSGAALVLAACALVHQLGLRDRLGVLTLRVESLERLHGCAGLVSTSAGYGIGIGTQAPITAVRNDASERAIAEGRRDLAGASKEIGQ